MKKNYSKPDIFKESLALQSVTVMTCSDAASAWAPIDMFDGYVIFVPNEVAGCNILPDAYMAETGDDDKDCIYASTWDGTTFTS